MSSLRRASLKRSRSSSSLANAQAEDIPSGPLSGPSSTRWRRERLLSIGNERANQDENAPLSPQSTRSNYGAVPSQTRPRRSKSKLNIRRGIASLQGLVIPKSSYSTPPTPGGASPASFVEHLSYLRERPISAYDRPNFEDNKEPGNAEGDVKTNGIRVWYSSFTSIDWLHDAIKDSTRQARLRRRKSLRGKARRLFDRSIGWLVVSIVGFLTAVIACLITRSEQWLFDFKEGYCEWAWYKSKRFCCPVVDDNQLSMLPVFLSSNEDELCPGWRLWSDVFGPVVDGSPWLLFEAEMVEYIAYIVVAVSRMLFSNFNMSRITIYTSSHGRSSHACSQSDLLLQRRSKLARTLVCFLRHSPTVAKRIRARLPSPILNAKCSTMYV